MYEGGCEDTEGWKRRGDRCETAERAGKIGLEKEKKREEEIGSCLVAMMEEEEEEEEFLHSFTKIPLFLFSEGSPTEPETNQPTKTLTS